MQNSDFSLRFVEGFRVEKPRTCSIIREVIVQGTAEGLLIEVDPPLLGRDYGLDFDEISSLVISPRYADESFSPMSQLPVTVYVFIPLTAEVNSMNSFGKGELKKIAFGEVYSEGEPNTKPAIIHRVNPL